MNLEHVERYKKWQENPDRQKVWNLMHEAEFEKDYNNKIKYCLESEKIVIEKLNSDIVELHFIFNTVIESFYHQRNIDKNSISRCIDYCIRDIDNFPYFIECYRYHEFYSDIKNDFVIPNAPSFKRLAIIYEKQRKYKESIEVCKLAVKYKQNDHTKLGFLGRIKKLENKIESMR
jgi:hypothetical protein